MNTSDATLIDSLRASMREARGAHPFFIHGWMVLPDQLHCVIELPPGDAEFATRWHLIKGGFSRRLPTIGGNDPADLAGNVSANAAAWPD